MTYDNIESHKETGPHTLSKRYIFGKPQGGSNGPSAFFGLTQVIKLQYKLSTYVAIQQNFFKTCFQGKK